MTSAAPSNRLLMVYIHRVNLHVMWLQEESTVAKTLRQFCKGKDLSNELGLNPDSVDLGP